MATPFSRLSPNELVEAVRGNPERAEAALEELVRRAVDSGDDPHLWSDTAAAYFHAGKLGEAIEILRQLTERYPQEDDYRLNLAMSYWQTGNVALCRHHLKHLTESANNPEIRVYARRQLEHYEASLGLGPRDRQLAALQEASLRETTASSKRTAAAYVRLGRLLVRQGKLSGDEEYAIRAASILERGRSEFPGEPAILEMLALCYLHDDPESRLDAVLRELERIDPDSAVFQTLDQAGRQQAEEHFEAIYNRAGSLLHQATTGSEDERAAAISDLRRTVAEAPQNPEYRLLYAFALAANGRREEALEQAAVLAGRESRSHSFHFNLGQIFWLSGCPLEGRRHLELAVECAGTEQERQDALERIAELEDRK